MKNLLMVTGLLAVLLAAVVFAVGNSNNKPVQSNSDDSTLNPAASGQPAGQVTNGIMPKRNPDGSLALSAEMQNAVSTSHEGLVEVTAPGGGTMVDLQGRFRSLSAAETNTDGTITVKCLGGTVVSNSTDTEQHSETNHECGEVSAHE